jgi:RimJ/RimL family protein N-acetyltransferase
MSARMAINPMHDPEAPSLADKCSGGSLREPWKLLGGVHVGERKERSATDCGRAAGACSDQNLSRDRGDGKAAESRGALSGEVTAPVSTVTLRSPFPVEDVPRIWEWIEPFRWRVSDDYSPKTLAEFVVYFRGLSARCRTWAVYRNRELGGLITYEALSPIVGTAHCTFKKSFWGSKTTVPALEQAIAEMLAESPKLSLPVMQGNKAMIALLARMGATQEGVLRKHTMREGRPIDVVMMAIFRPEAEQRKVA